MKTEMRKAFDSATGQEYQIEMPAREEVKKAIFDPNFPFPPQGIRVRDAAAQLAQKFRLSDEQKQAKTKSRNYVFRYDVVRPVIEKELEQPDGPGTPYVRPNQRPDSSHAPPSPPVVPVPNPVPTPRMLIEESHKRIQDALSADLLQRIQDNSPDFFEELVIDLLVAMGYGGSREEAGRAVGGSGDGGIDRVINEDILGLDVIYVQAKRWQADVGEPPVRDFVGALQGRRARKGIFITTSAFSNRAKEYVSSIDSRDTKIVLIDGHQLAQFMIDYNVGVSVTKSYEIKRVDSDYFAEEGE